MSSDGIDKKQEYRKAQYECAREFGVLQPDSSTPLRCARNDKGDASLSRNDKGDASLGRNDKGGRL